jgi:hypothetical protein
MPSTPPHPRNGTLPGAIPPHLIRPLKDVLQAHQAAQEAGVSVWEFAVELAGMRSAGLTTTELRQLVRRGVLRHRRETTVGTRGPRTFVTCHATSFGDRPAFVLTDAAAAALQAATEGPEPPSPPAANATAPTRSGPKESPRPRWDPEARQLWLGDALLLTFKRPAPRQERVLAAFQKRRWKRWIPDPFYRVRDKFARRHLKWIIRGLNRSLGKNARIRFRGDGKGDGICWEIVWEIVERPGR